MKIIQINLGQMLIVDDGDWEKIKNYSWSTGWDKRRKSYVCPSSHIKHRNVILSRFLLDAPKGLQVDHVNRNQLDNRRSNLRLCNNSLNNHNKGLFKNNKTGIRGVYLDKYHKKYRAEIKMYKKIFLGYFETKEEASKVYEAKKKELITEAYKTFLEEVKENER